MIVMGDAVENIQKMRNNKEYHTEEMTSTAGGRLIINTIKKKPKGKKIFKKKEHIILRPEDKKDKQNNSDSDSEDLEVNHVPELADNTDQFGVDKYFDKEEGEEILNVEEVEEIEEDEDFDDYKTEDNDNDDEEEEEENSEDEEDDKFEAQQKLDAKRPDFIEGMKVFKIIRPDMIPFEEDVAMQESLTYVKEESSDDEDYTMGTKIRIKVKGEALLSAEMMTVNFAKQEVNDLNILKEKKAVMRKKKIFLVDKVTRIMEERKQKEIDEELLENARLEEIQRIKNLRRRGKTLTEEEKLERKKAVKDIKQERKEKKQQFKNKFEQTKKGYANKNEQQVRNENLQGVSVLRIN